MTNIDFHDLRDSVRGEVRTPDSEGWADALAGHNPAVAHDPAAILEASDVADIPLAVTFAARHGLTVTVQATGHGPSRIARGGLLVRTDRLKSIEVDPVARTVRVAPGVVWGDLLTATAEHGLAPLGMASVASVGVVGYTVGGGIGPFGRSQGFGADHVRSVDLVTADGQVRTVDVGDPDLFWAVRGGRLGLGVITAMTLDVADAPAVASSSLTFARPDVPAALPAWAEWQSELGEQTSTVATLMRFPDAPQLPEELRGQRFLQIDVAHLGDEATLRTSVDRLAAQVEPQVRNDLVGDPSTWMHAQPPIPIAPTWNRAALVDGLDDDAAERILRELGPEADSPWQVAELRPLGGALARPPADDNAVGIRPDGVLVNTVAGGDPATFGDLPAAHDTLVAALGHHVRPGAPVNFQGLTGPEHPLADAWSAAVHARLETIREEVDPDGLFAPRD